MIENRFDNLLTKALRIEKVSDCIGIRYKCARSWVDRPRNNSEASNYSKIERKKQEKTSYLPPYEGSRTYIKIIMRT